MKSEFFSLDWALFVAIVISNATLVDFDPMRVESGALRVEDGRITDRASSLTPGPGDEFIDCHNAVVLPGLVNGHTHLYSALAVGMPAPARQPQDFLEILKFVWWRLDQALDAESIEMSARMGSLEALRHGTTTLIDHHASPNSIDGSLDLIERAIADTGLRGILCYETTDRHGPEGREAGLAENHRYIDKFRRARSNQFAGMVGAHAAFTLEDETLQELANLAAQLGCGVHIHVAEDACDEDMCHQQHQVSLIDRLAGYGLLKPNNIFAHGTQLDPDAIGRVSRSGLTLAHNPRSNMNNAVGYAPVGIYTCPVMLGTDGIGADLFAEARCAWLIARDAHGGLSPDQIIAMLATAARVASDRLDVTLGRLEVDAAADIVITDYHPPTPLHAGNVAGHILFALGSEYIRHVIARGELALHDRKVATADERHIRTEATAVAQALWQRIQEVPLQ